MISKHVINESIQSFKALSPSKRDGPRLINFVELALNMR